MSPHDVSNPWRITMAACNPCVRSCNLRHCVSICGCMGIVIVLAPVGLSLVLLHVQFIVFINHNMTVM